MIRLERHEKDILLLLYIIFIGVISGVIVWSFLKLMNLGIYFFWDYVPGLINFKYYTLVLCLSGGLLIGLWKHKFGQRPEELITVINKVKKDHRYSYNNIFSSIVSSLLPLIFGASVGPEAGLIGIIAGLYTWIGDKIKIFNNEVDELAKIGITATLGTIFVSPIFGFVEPIENEDNIELPKTSKNIQYFVAILSSFGIFILLNHLTNNNMGLHSIGTATLTNLNYLYIILLMFIGVILAYLYFVSSKIIKVLFKNLIDNIILKCVIGGLLLGIIGTLLPLSMFSGEEQIYLLLENGAEISLIIIILTSIMKILLTNICIESGLKGGHFFPMIFSGIAMGYAMGIVLHMDPIISMSIVTASFMANILKKPLAVVLLLMIIFPMNLMPLILAAAVISSLFKTPEVL